jgi:hypothetical protein
MRTTWSRLLLDYAPYGGAPGVLELFGCPTSRPYGALIFVDWEYPGRRAFDGSDGYDPDREDN